MNASTITPEALQQRQEEDRQLNAWIAIHLMGKTPPDQKIDPEFICLMPLIQRNRREQEHRGWAPRFTDSHHYWISAAEEKIREIGLADAYVRACGDILGGSDRYLSTERIFRIMTLTNRQRCQAIYAIRDRVEKKIHQACDE